jgi:signal transduction histidine kinase/ActR/RegA family two-component response regulator
MSRGRAVWKDEKTGRIRVVGTHSDITPMKIIQQKMIAETELLLVTLRSIGEGMIATDHNGRVMVMNSLAEKMTGCKAQDATANRSYGIPHRIGRYARHGRRPPVVKIHQLAGNNLRELSLVSATFGRFVDQNVSPILDPGGNVFGVVIIFRDITDQKQIDEYIRMKDRFDAMGVLAGSIAHDFNNYLTVLLGNISILKYYVKDDATTSILKDSENAALIAKQLTQQLMNFARAGEPVKKIGSVEQPIRNSVSLCFSGTKTEIELDIAPGLLNIDMDESQISQAFSNIFINAVQAMQGGGRVWIKAENAVGNEMPKEILPEDNYIKITVRAEGEGIPEKYLDKLFDPFFTTKDKATGLGLASVFTIIKRHKGYVTVDSVVGKGTKFTIYLPAVKDYRKLEEKPQTVDERFAMKPLMMDDDEMILTVGKRLLEYLGCETGTAHSGEEAIAAVQSARRDGKPFDVVFLDLNVPSGSGALTTVGKAKSIDPDVKVVLVTAMTNHPQVKNYKEAGFDGIMTKPFSLDDLKKVLTGLKAG